MNIIKAYINGWKHWKRWDGRTRRRDYWGYTLCHILVFMMLYISFMLFAALVKEIPVIPMLLIFVYAFVSVVPTIAITIRRLHDTDHGGLYYFVQMVPLIGEIWFLVLMCQEGTRGKNRFGLDPKEILYDDGTSVESGDYPDFRS